MTEGLFGVSDGGDVLERLGYDLTAAARRGDLEPVRCRDEEISRVVDILLRQTKHNPALVGEAGVGKTAIVEGLAQRIVARDVPAALRGVRIVALDHVALLAGTVYRGQYEERMRRLVRAVGEDPDVILFVDEMHNLIGQGTAMGAAMDAANMLKPALVRADIRVIGATTGAEYERWIKGDPALERRFQPVLVRELTAEQTMEILRARRPRLEHHHAVAIEEDALQAALVLTDRFVTDRAQPDKAIDVLDEACAHAQATATLPAELERIVRQRRRVDAAIRRRLANGEAVGRPGGGATGTAGATREPGEGNAESRGGDEAAEPDPFAALAREVAPVLERLGAEIEKLFGGTDAQSHGRTDAQTNGRTDAPGHGGAGAPARESLLERRDRLDQELRYGLASLGVVVRGQDVARAVGVAVGKRIEWAGTP
jgi:ATP-dependent Clp protease ATP-binding subunit ClpA